LISLYPDKIPAWINGERVKGFLKALEESGLKGKLIPEACGPYNARIKVISPEGEFPLTIYHSPRKNSYKIDLRQVLKENIREELEETWHGESARPGKGYHVYADGSCLGESTGYGAVILKDNRVLRELCGPVSPGKVSGTRQVAGEIEGVKSSLAWCASDGAGEVTVHYDYEGLKKWVTGEWRAKMPLTREYREFVRSLGLKLTWVKVEAHTGDRWNERADRLARKGAGGA